MSYVPRPGSIPHQVIEHLQQHGGHLTSSEIERRFGVKAGHVAAILSAAITGGGLVREPIDARRNAYRLPDRAFRACRLDDGALVLMNAYVDPAGCVCLRPEQTRIVAKLLNEPMADR